MRRNGPGPWRLLLVLLAAAVALPVGAGLPARDKPAPPAESLVLVAGASGRTGRLIVGELAANGYRVRAFVRDAAKAREILGADVELAEGDVRSRTSIDAALTGVTKMVSAIGASTENPRNGPEFVDFGGVKNLAEAASAAHLDHLVLISSTGVTHKDHMLNRVFGNILIWKFKGEEAVRASGVPYTIVRPGGLSDEPGGNSVVLEQGDTRSGFIPRADVAKICVRALMHPESRGKTFEAFGSDGPPIDDWRDLFAGLSPDEQKQAYGN